MTKKTNLIIAKILKQLALILEEKGFVLYYDKHFPPLKPKINNKCDYLYRDVLGHDQDPFLQFQCRDKDYQIDYCIGYNEDFPQTLHYSKHPYPNFHRTYNSLSVSFNPHKDYSEEEARELAMKLYQDLIKQPIESRIDNDLSFAKFHDAVVLNK